jgi:hypothetical protein
MVTFHPRQPDRARRAHKNEYAGTVNFITQIAPLICTVMHTKRVKPDAAIFKSRCSRMAVSYRFREGHALLLSPLRFLRLAISSPMAPRSPARQSRNVRKPSRKISGEMSRPTSAQYPGNCRAVAKAMPANVRADDSQDASSEFCHHVFNHDFSKL